MDEKIKIGVCADLHVDIMHDGEERLAEFLEDCRKEDVDFVIQLGDFCYPDEDRKCVSKPENLPVNIANALKFPTYANKDKIITMYKNFEKPAYHVIGNHDCDMCSKQQILDYYGADYGPYYSFDMKGFHFVVLDGNYMKLDGEYVSYDNGRYFDEYYHQDVVMPFVSEEQLKWLEKDLAATPYPSILFSHQRLTKDPVAILNHEDVRKIINNAPNGVVLAMNGHEHIDNAQKVDNTWFYNVNSMSNQWLDKEFEHPLRYTAEIDEKFPNIKYVVPYKDAVYAIVTIDKNGATVRGKKSEFVGKTPEEQGVYNTEYFQKCHIHTRMTPSVEDRYMPFGK